MKFEELQRTWISQVSGPQLAVPSDVLLREVERNRNHFVRTIFWRDAREVGVALCLVPLFLWLGVNSGYWPLFVPAIACLAVAVFMVADRWNQRRKTPAASDPLRACVESSLSQINHQIWLLRNVFWWYLLPLGVGVEFPILIPAWRMYSLGLWRGAATPLGVALGCAALYWGIHRLNQMAVQKTLIPRRGELEDLLASLNQ